MPLQRAIERHARADQALAVVDQQPDVELGPANAAVGSVSIPRRQRRARDRRAHRSDRSCRARGSSAGSRPSAASRRERHARRARSGTAPSAPETCRQSSSAHTRSPSRPRAQITSAANPRAPTATVLSPSSSTGRSVDRRDRVRALVGVRPEHDHDLVHVLSDPDSWTPGGHGLLGALPRSYQVTPDIPDRRRATQQKEVRPPRPTASKRVSSPPGRDPLLGVGRHRPPNPNSKPRSDSALRARPRWLLGPPGSVLCRTCMMPVAPSGKHRARRQPPHHPDRTTAGNGEPDLSATFWGTSPMDTNAAEPSRARSCSAAGTVRMNGRRACLTRRTIGWWRKRCSRRSERSRCCSPT